MADTRSVSGRRPLSFARSLNGRRSPGIRPFPSVRRRLLACVGALVVAFTAVTMRLIVWPSRGAPPRADAIVMLAGPGGRLPLAVGLAREHLAPVLVVSRGHDGYGGPCPAPVAGVRLICFDPDPADTRGEAEYVGKLAARYHWHSIVLVTALEQDTRARLLLERCFGGPVYVVTASLPLSSLPYQIAYEWGAIIKAETIYRSC